ncbi:MAG: transposase [Spirochaetaceae bacterium]
MVGLAEGAKEARTGWSSFLTHLKARRLRRVRSISDKCMGLVKSVSAFVPEARRQRCVLQIYRDVFTVAPKGTVREVAAMLKAIHAQENRKEAPAKASYVENTLREMTLPKAAELFG